MYISDYTPARNSTILQKVKIFKDIGTLYEEIKQTSYWNNYFNSDDSSPIKCSTFKK